jgi:hypothetical protein
MHAVAYPNAYYNLDATCGVEVAFLDSFNSYLGSARLINTSESIGSHEVLIDDQQHFYSNLLSDYVTLAGLSAADPISKVSLSYFATAESVTTYNPYPSVHHSSATVWFDNVNVSSVPVPVPGAIILGMLGLSAVGIKMRKFA